MKQWYIFFRVRNHLICCACWLGVSGFLLRDALAGPDGCIGQPGPVKFNIPRILPGNSPPYIEIVRDGISRSYRVTELPPGVGYEATGSGYRLKVSEEGYYTSKIQFRAYKNYYSLYDQWHTSYSDWYSVNLEESPFVTHPRVPYEEGLQPSPSLHPLKEEYVTFLARQKGSLVYHDPELIGCVEYDAGIFLDPETGMTLLQQIIDSPEMDGKKLLVLLGGQPETNAIGVSEPIIIRGQGKSVTIAGISPCQQTESGSGNEVLSRLSPVSGDGSGSDADDLLLPVSASGSGSGADADDLLLSMSASGSGSGDENSCDPEELIRVVAKGGAWNGRAVIECRDDAKCQIVNIRFEEDLQGSQPPAAFIRGAGGVGRVINCEFDSGGQFTQARDNYFSIIYFRNVFSCAANGAMARDVCLLAHPRVVCRPPITTPRDICDSTLINGRTTLTCTLSDANPSPPPPLPHPSATWNDGLTTPTPPLLPPSATWNDSLTTSTSAVTGIFYDRATSTAVKSSIARIGAMTLIGVLAYIISQ